jgi:hypothetical protein
MGGAGCSKMTVEWLRDLWRLWILWRLWHLRVKPEEFEDFGLRQSRSEARRRLVLGTARRAGEDCGGGFWAAELGFGIGLAWFEGGFEVGNEMVECAALLQPTRVCCATAYAEESGVRSWESGGSSGDECRNDQTSHPRAGRRILNRDAGAGEEWWKKGRAGVGTPDPVARKCEARTCLAIPDAANEWQCVSRGVSPQCSCSD